MTKREQELSGVGTPALELRKKNVQQWIIRSIKLVERLVRESEMDSSQLTDMISTGCSQEIHEPMKKHMTLGFQHFNHCGEELVSLQCPEMKTKHGAVLMWSYAKGLQQGAYHLLEDLEWELQIREDARAGGKPGTLTIAALVGRASRSSEDGPKKKTGGDQGTTE